MLDLAVDHLCVLLHSERSTCGRLPDILLIIIVLAHHTDLVGNKVTRVEPNTKLANHGDVTACSHSLHKGLGARLSNCAQVVDELVLGHANSGVLNGRPPLWTDISVLLVGRTQKLIQPQLSSIS